MKPADQTFTPNNVNAMMKELKEDYENVILNEWESQFYEWIRGRVEAGVNLTPAQFDKLRDIYQEYRE
jgi:hypothetical protein